MNAYLSQWSGMGLIDLTLKALLVIALAACMATLLPAKPMNTPEPTVIDITAGSWTDAAPEIPTPWWTDMSRLVSAGSIFTLVVWAVGFFLLIVRAGVGLTRLDRLRRSTDELTDPAWQTLLAQAKERTGIARDVRLLMSERVRTPITWGLRQVFICLPTHAEAWAVDNRYMVLAHELTHVRRGDWLWQMLVIPMTAVHWFNPLAWWAAHRLRTESEIACDDAMLEQGWIPSSYADCLYLIVRAAKAAPLHLNPAMPMARPSELPVRMARILSDKTIRRQTGFHTLIGTLVLSMLLGSAVAAARVGRVQPALDDPQTSERELPPDLDYDEAVSLIQEALDQERLTREQAIERWEDLRQRRWNENGIAREQADPRSTYIEALTDSGIKREQIEPVFDAISKLATEMKSKGTDIEIDPGYVDHLESEGLTHEQIRLALGLAQRIAYSERQEDRALRGQENLRLGGRYFGIIKN